LSAHDLNDLAGAILKSISAVNNYEGINEREVNLDTIAVGLTADNKVLIIAGNVKQRQGKQLPYGKMGFYPGVNDIIIF
jgi:hypothetical protein